MAKDKGNPYGLPDLTIEEAARILGLEVAQFELWLWKVFPKSPQQRSMWFGGYRSLPPEVLHYYLDWKTKQAKAAAEEQGPPAPPSATEDPAEGDEEPQQRRATGTSGRPVGKAPPLERRSADSRGSKRVRRG